MCSIRSELHSLITYMLTVFAALLLNFFPASVTYVAGAGDLISDEVLQSVSVISTVEGEKKVCPFNHPDGSIVVIVFGSVNCPVANTLVPEIRRIHTQAKSVGGFMYLVHPSRTVSVEKMRDHGKERKLRMPIVHDPKHQLVESLKATTTPEAFVIRRDGDHWVVVYRGLIDNLYADVGRRRRNATQFYVREAIASAVAKKPLEIKKRTPIGCLIEAGVAP